MCGYCLGVKSMASLSTKLKVYQSDKLLSSEPLSEEDLNFYEDSCQVVESEYGKSVCLFIKGSNQTERAFIPIDSWQQDEVKEGDKFKCKDLIIKTLHSTKQNIDYFKASILLK